MKKFIKNTLLLATVAGSISACVPKKIELGLNASTLTAVNQFGSTAQEVANKLKDGIDDLRGKAKNKADQAGVHNVEEAKAKIVDSIRGYTRPELGSLIIFSDEVRTQVEAFELAHGMQCYSNQSEYLNYKKIADQSYNFVMNMICFDGKTLPEVLNSDVFTENKNLTIPGISSELIGNVSWSKEQGIHITPGIASDAIVQAVSYPADVVKAAQKELIRLVPTTPAKN